MLANHDDKCQAGLVDPALQIVYASHQIHRMDPDGRFARRFNKALSPQWIYPERRANRAKDRHDDHTRIPMATTHAGQENESVGNCVN